MGELLGQSNRWTSERSHENRICLHSEKNAIPSAPGLRRWFMKALVEKLSVGVRHFAILNDFFVAASPEYRVLHEKMAGLTSYPEMAELFYPPQNKRQMALFEVSYYIVVGRAWWVASKSDEGKVDYIKFLLYFVNLLCMQEHLACGHPEIRRRLLDHMEGAGLDGFFQRAEDKAEYEACKNNEGFIEAHRRDRDYVVVDGLLPKSIGNAIELIVYVSLLQGDLGFPVLLQLQQRLMMREAEIVAPDLLLIARSGKVFGIEVGQGTGQFSLKDSKIRQVNAFVSATKLPILTALVPFPYRCPECNEWILYCDQVIDEFAANGRPKGQVSRKCPTCPRFDEGRCRDIIYYGRTEVRGQPLHHHLRCVQGIPYVGDILCERGQRDNRLCNYYPYFEGLDGIDV
jgi:hypothetical protein